MIKGVDPTYPADPLKKHISGTVIMRIVVDKNRKISDAKALSGPNELFPASVEAAKQYQFEPPQNEPMPPYPEEAREAGKEGDLEILITVAPSGEVVRAGDKPGRSCDLVASERALQVLSGQSGSGEDRLLRPINCPH